MFKIYQKYLILDFLKKYSIFSIIFLFLIFTLGVLEEITFLKDLTDNNLLAYILTLLNSPITLFEIFPFIFILTTQYQFYDLFKKDELNLLKINGMSNIKILSILFVLSIFLGIFNISIFYNVASKLKFHYSNIKNELSSDNKYLAMVTDSGLWIKDEINDQTLIIKANYIKGNILNKTIINEFNKDFELIRSIQSNKIDFKNNRWVIFNPIITKNNIDEKIDTKIYLETNFNEDKINSLFSDISTLAMFELFSLKKDFSKLGYTSSEIDAHLLKLFTHPILCGILTIISAIIMLTLKIQKSLIFQIVLGIFISVIIYYINFVFVSLGVNGKIPLSLSVLFPIVFLSLISLIFLIRINEK